MSAISVRDVSKTYAEGAASVRALESANMRVESGEVVLLMGPSGSGKTTLLSIMGCILRPTSGEVRINDRVVSSLKERDLPAVRLKHIGFIFQGFNLFPTLTARENVELTLDVKGINRGTNRRAARRRADELIERVGLSDRGHAFPADLSGGQKQRVAIARALAGDPEIILADEPTAALDAESGRSITGLLRDLARDKGRSVIVVTHDARLEEFADRIVHIEDGRTETEETEQEII
jgi:putative ABC transport system ATP-binding protein